MYREDHYEVRAAPNLMIRGIDVYVFNKLRQDVNQTLTKDGFQDYKPFEYVNPTVSIYEEDAQQLFNDLWDAGLRPKKPDEYVAKDEHINDLRTIAFHALGIKKDV